MLAWHAPSATAELAEARLADMIMAPYRLGEPAGLDGVWTIETSDGGLAGYVFESEPLAPIPGFAGEPMNLLITLDTTGRILDVTLLDHNEPIFVAGLGPAPFLAFLAQYRGLSVADSITIEAGQRSARGAGSTHVSLDGVTKATASVRIANESIMAAALKVARERLQGIAPSAAARPLPDYREDLTWQGLVDQGIARHLRVTNAELRQAFAGSLWEQDDPEPSAPADEAYLDLWVVDIGPPSITRAVLDADTVADLERTAAPHEEPILLLADGRHRLVDEDFVRNTEPDRIAAVQGGLPVSLRDADLDVDLAEGVPAADQAMILFADTRLGFDPVSPWTLLIRVIREHGQFMPEIGARDFDIAYQAPARFFETPELAASTPPWRAALEDRAAVLAATGAGLVVLVWLLARRAGWLARQSWYRPFRFAVLGLTVAFIGWWAHGQLSIVTPLGVLRSAAEGKSLVFLLYEPLLLLLWTVTLLSLVAWGRGFFCGWLCPFGALQEFAHALGRRLRLPEYRVPPGADRRLKYVKYAVLVLLIGATLTSATAADMLVEVEPFKTAITMGFDRALPYVLYAAFWLVLGVFVFKGFCRYVCPLGAALALAGKVRRFDWIARRAECGSPCQYCKAQCAYGAIERDGRIDYDECFQCLDCVKIYEDPRLCVPERVARKRARRWTPVQT